MLHVIADDVWGFEQDLRLPGGMRLPARSVVVRLADGGLVLHSPLSFDDAAAREVDALGDVRVIVAPSCIHYLFLKAATERWPRARVLGPPGLDRKVPGLPYEELPRSGTVAGIGDALTVRRIDGAPYMTEHVFLHVPSRSLVVTDLVFNVHRCNFGMQLFLRLAGAYKKTAQSRAWRLFTKEAKLAAESAREVLGWDFDRVVVAHGDVVEDDARARLARALGRMTAPAEPKLLVA